MSIKVKCSGNYNQTRKYLEATIDISKLKLDDIQKIAEETVEKLAKASPYESIANGWSYTIESDHKQVSLYFCNSYVENGLNIALLIDKGHGTANGNWVTGKHYIDGQIKEAYRKILEAARKEIKSL